MKILISFQDINYICDPFYVPHVNAVACVPLRVFEIRAEGGQEITTTCSATETLSVENLMHSII